MGIVRGDNNHKIDTVRTGGFGPGHFLIIGIAAILRNAQRPPVFRVFSILREKQPATSVAMPSMLMERRCASPIREPGPPPTMP